MMSQTLAARAASPAASSGTADAWAYALPKRALDVAAAVSLGLFTLPLLVGLFVWVRCDGGPALFKHERVGKDGRRFKVYKFRSMCLEGDKVLSALLERCPKARAEWAARQKLTDDPRVTPAGRFLRKSSLDELPQLINILRGEMSLVGPRPVTAEELDRYGSRRAEYLSCVPGVTGLWQVSGRSETTYARRVALDAMYARRKTMLLDAYILLKTGPAVLSQSGAE